MTQILDVYALYQLGVKNQRLISRSLDFGWVTQAQNLMSFDRHLTLLLHKAAKFDFVGQTAKGKMLLVGEGNLSFALSLARKSRINPTNIMATTFETSGELSPEANTNAQTLKSLGASVVHGINSTKIDEVFHWQRYETIVFQFPHVGSREPVNGRNPNFILVRDFLKSAAHILTDNGVVLISAVDSPHYRGAFQFEEAADEAGFAEPAVYPFEPDNFPGYSHIVTNQDESALDNHDDFSTWVFRLE